MHPKYHIVITAPELDMAFEGQWISALLQLGIGKVHIRKPKASAEEIARLLASIPKRWRHRCVLSEHGELVRRYHLGGLHLSVKSCRTCSQRPKLEAWQTLSVSCHSAEELKQLPFLPDYAYLSPVAESLSKAGYGQNTWTSGELRGLCLQSPCPLVALGGGNALQCQSLSAIRLSSCGKFGLLAGVKHPPTRRSYSAYVSASLTLLWRT